MCGSRAPFAGRLLRMSRAMPVITGWMTVPSWARKRPRLHRFFLRRRRLPDGYGRTRAYRTGGW